MKQGGDMATGLAAVLPLLCFEEKRKEGK